MPKIKYKDYKPRPDAKLIIRQAEAICSDYEAQGYNLTLRQLYYQFVSRDIIPNNMRSYKRLGSIIDDARMGGLLDWDHIVDRTRNLRSNSHWVDPNEIIKGASRSFMLDRWFSQPTRVEVWVEKEALAEVVQRAAEEFDCAWFCCRGYTSSSEMWAAAQRLGGYISRGQDVVVLHLGDHDPSGIDMSRDIQDRLRKFIFTDFYQRGKYDSSYASYEAIGKLIEERLLAFDETRTPSGWGGLEVHRIALNMDQVQEYDPPPNPAKLTDSRAEKYVDEFGPESWELDALEPQVLNELITSHIETYVRRDLYDARRWEEIVEFLNREPTDNT
jgi:hypothetical protein